MSVSNEVPAKLWLLLATGPTLFFIAFATLSVAFSVTGTAPTQISEKVSAFIPHCLIFVLASLGIVTLAFGFDVPAVWRLQEYPVVLVDALIGVVAGVALAALYFVWLEPALRSLQKVYGDYVPPGSILPSLSGNLALFFVANVILAPLVEETVYRGIALPVLSAKLGSVVAVTLSCLAFGALHWAGGFWYMLLTGSIAGGSLAALYLWRGGILAPFVAHLTLNLIEYVHAYQGKGNA